MCDTDMFKGSVISIWDVTGDSASPPIVRLRHKLPEAERGYCDASFFPDRRTLVVSNCDKTALLWDVESAYQIASFAPNDGVPWGFVADCVAVAPDGQTFATWGTMASGSGIDRRCRRPGPWRRGQPSRWPCLILRTPAALWPSPAKGSGTGNLTPAPCRSSCCCW